MQKLKKFLQKLNENLSKTQGFFQKLKLPGLLGPVMFQSGVQKKKPGSITIKKSPKNWSQVIWTKTRWEPELQSTAFSDLIFNVKKGQYGENKVTFIPAPIKVVFIKVGLFLRFGHFLMVKSASKMTENHLEY